MTDYNSVLDFLKEIDNRLKRKIVLIAVGGTAMVFMKLKEATKDVDFCIESEYLEDFEKAKKGIKEIFRIDLFKDGYIFCQQLPDDYDKLAGSFKNGLKHIELKLLHPIDIIVTKSARLNERDKEDIAVLIKKKKIKKEKLVERFKEVKKSCPACDKNLEYNFNWLVKTFFKNKV